MAKLHFYYSTMNAGKSTLLLQANHNYQTSGHDTLLFIPKETEIISNKKIVSRIGLSADALIADKNFNFVEYFSSNNPYIDAATTVFSFIASYMQAKRVLSSWHFWIVINAVSIWLYYQRGLEVYSLLMVVYFALSIAGLFQWSRLLSAQARLRQDVS